MPIRHVRPRDSLLIVLLWTVVSACGESSDLSFCGRVCRRSAQCGQDTLGCEVACQQYFDDLTPDCRTEERAITQCILDSGSCQTPEQCGRKELGYDPSSCYGQVLAPYPGESGTAQITFQSIAGEPAPCPLDGIVLDLAAQAPMRDASGARMPDPNATYQPIACSITQVGQNYAVTANFQDASGAFSVDVTLGADGQGSGTLQASDTAGGITLVAATSPPCTVQTAPVEGYISEGTLDGAQISFDCPRLLTADGRVCRATGQFEVAACFAVP